VVEDEALVVVDVVVGEAVVEASSPWGSSSAPSFTHPVAHMASAKGKSSIHRFLCMGVSILGVMRTLRVTWVIATETFIPA
jgi:hypothetical protein